MELSLCMIVRDEEQSLGRCLESVRGAVDEIVILDTGSVDGTREVARRFTDRVYDYVWQDDFAAARNASFSYARKPFILWLDADDVLESTEREKLIALKARLDERVDAVMMPYHCACDENGEPALIFERERIVRRGAGFVFSGVVHEAMAVSGNVIHEDIIVRHMGGHGARSSGRNLAIYELWLARGRKMTPRDQYYYARELMDCGQTARAEQAFDVFLQREDGWMENRVDAYVQRARCLTALGRRKEAREALLHALSCGAPRAEALCALGEGFMEEGDLHAAIFWYQAAMLTQAPVHTGAFVQPGAYDYVPAMQLCVCYDRLGQRRLAAQMNERALLARPGDEAALSNRRYFENLLGGTRENEAEQGKDSDSARV